MSDGDLAAIATYLKTLPPPAKAARTRPRMDVMASGRSIFIERCAFCHQERADASSGAYPRLAGNTLVTARDPTTILRVILQGSQAAEVPGVQVGYSMPAFPVFTNEELAAVATYIRNAWGNEAEPVSAGQAATVAKQ